MLEEYPWKVMETLQKAVRGVPTEGDSSSTRSIARQMGRNGEPGFTETLRVLMVKFDGTSTFINLSILSKLYISI